MAIKKGEKDFTVMRIIMKGKENGKDTIYRYDLLDRYQDETISMARTHWIYLYGGCKFSDKRNI